MKRHTFISDGYYAISGEENFDDQNEDYCGAAIDKLAEYENAEEQGRLVILPCKVGETIFIIGSKYRSGKVDKWINTGRFRLSDIEKLGKTVFLTHEEAEEALNRIKGD